MKSSFEGFGRVFETVTGAMAAFGAVLAGGRMFKEAIDATVNLTKESVSLGRQFGISATEASDLKVALSSVFVTQDQLSAAGNAVTRSCVPMRLRSSPWVSLRATRMGIIATRSTLFWMSTKSSLR